MSKLGLSIYTTLAMISDCPFKTASLSDHSLAADVGAGPVAGVRLHGGRVPPHEAAQQHQRLLHPQLCATPQGRNPPLPSCFFKETVSRQMAGLKVILISHFRSCTCTVVHCFRCGFGLDPDSIRSVDPDSEVQK
jgi:hypothetical protein